MAATVPLRARQRKRRSRSHWPRPRERVKLRGIDPAAPKKPRLLRLSLSHMAAAVGVFAVEVAIARYVQHGFVRTFAGDVLVVVLLYFAVRSLWDLAPRWTALGVFLFACTIELGQAAQLVQRLGLEHIRLARIIIGTAYDPLDFAAYALGAALVLLEQRLTTTKRLR